MVETTVSAEPSKRGTPGQEDVRMVPAVYPDTDPVWIEPDLDFVRKLNRQGGDSLKKCIQCGTCSGTCTLTPDALSFPCKELAWAGWGMKNRLINDPDVWLCYQCNDCSSRCPRNVRPGDVLGAIRQECIAHYAFPRFLGRWVNQPHSIPLLLGIPIALLTLALVFRDRLEKALCMASFMEGRIVYSYSSIFPHWLLNLFFFSFSGLALIATAVGVVRFWRALGAHDSGRRPVQPVKGLLPSLGAVLKSVFTHEKFAQCDNARSRYWSHSFIFFGFFALCAVTLWVITARINPLINDEFVYPFGFWNPWKILANLGGLSLLVGCGLIMLYRLLKDPGLHGRKLAGAGTYFDWALISTLLLVVLSGFFTEVLHYIRLEPHRHVVYFIHLVFVFALLVYLPYSKFAHVVYRTTALVYAEHTGRAGGRPAREDSK